MNNAPSNSAQAQKALSVHQGKLAIEWAGRFMPVLESTISATEQQHALNQRRIAIALPVDAATGWLAVRLAAAGATPVVFSTRQTDNEHIILALKESGISIIHTADISPVADDSIALSKEPYTELNECLHDESCWFIGDDSALATLLQQRSAYPFPATLSPSSFNESVSSAHADGHSANAAKQPTRIDLAQSRLLQLTQQRFGIGQSAVMAFLDITNLQLAGQNVLVLGRGKKCAGITQYAAALGARVSLYSENPVDQVEALFEGHSIVQPAQIQEQFAQSTVLIFASTTELSLTNDTLNKLPDGAFILVVSHAPTSLTHWLDELHGEAVRDHVMRYHLSSGKSINVVGGLQPIQHSAAAGLPIGANDTLFSLHLQSLLELKNNDTVDALSDESADALSLRKANAAVLQSAETVIATRILNAHNPHESPLTSSPP